MATLSHLDRRHKLMDTVGQLSSVTTQQELVDILRDRARSISGADGITVVRRDGDQVTYIAEDAVGPLWTGSSFPIASCISGIAMIENQPILIPDIFADPRVPHAAYKPTFVRSMAMFPIGKSDPTLAVGIYWHAPRAVDTDTLTLLSSLARAATAAFERVLRLAQARRPKSIGFG